MANETQKTIGTWVKKEFDPTLEMQVKKLQEEVGEFAEDIANEDFAHAAEELADVVIVCFGIAFLMGFSILKKMNWKMLVNKKRQWHVVNGVSRHV